VEVSVAELCRREGIPIAYYKRRKDSIEGSFCAVTPNRKFSREQVEQLRRKNERLTFMTPDLSPEI